MLSGADQIGAILVLVQPYLESRGLENYHIRSVTFTPDEIEIEYFVHDLDNRPIGSGVDDELQTARSYFKYKELP